MFEQKAIAIPRDWGLQAFADALEAILSQLATEGWDSRMFQMGPSGVLILAHRARVIELLEARAFDTADRANALPFGDPDVPDPLSGPVRDLVDHVFDFVNTMPLSLAVEAAPEAVKYVASFYPYRFLDDAIVELENHLHDHRGEHGDSDESCEYSIMVAAVVEALRAELSKRHS